MWLRIQPRGFLDFTLDPSHPSFPGAPVKLEPERSIQIIAPSHRKSRVAHPDLKAPAHVQVEPNRKLQVELTFSFRGKPRSILKKPPVVGAGIYFSPIKVKINPSQRRVYESFRHTPRSIHPLIVGPFPRIEIPVADISHVGVAPLSQVSSDVMYKHYFVNDGNVYLEVYNANALTQSVTIISAATVDDLNVADLTISLTTGQTKLIGPFNIYTFNQLIPGNPTGFTYVFVDPSVQTDLKMRAFRLP